MLFHRRFRTLFCLIIPWLALGLSTAPERARPDPAPAHADSGGGYFQPPLLSDLPDDQNGGTSANWT